MRIVYLIVKYITLPGTFLQAFFEHLTCRVYEVLVEDGRYLRANEMCGHIQHELVRKRSTSFGICFFPFLFNLIAGLMLTAVGAVNVLYLGEFFTSGGSVHILNFLFLWVGISCLTNLFPQTEDALTFKELLYGKGKSNLFVKIIAAPSLPSVCRLLSAKMGCDAAHISGVRLCAALYFGYVPAAALRSGAINRPKSIKRRRPPKRRAAFFLFCFYLPRYGKGLTRLPLTRTSKCRCGPVTLPVEPILPIRCPAETESPADTRSEPRCIWAYNVESPLPWLMIT